MDDVEGVAVAASLRRGRPERASLLTALGRLFAAGVDPDWKTVQQAGRRVPVPSYPWQRTRFWVALPAAGSDLPAPLPMAHPLLGPPVDSPTLQGTAFDGVLSAQQPAWLSEHRIGAATIVPATALIEMALAASGDARALTDARASYQSFPITEANMADDPNRLSADATSLSQLCYTRCQVPTPLHGASIRMPSNLVFEGSFEPPSQKAVR